MLKITYYIYIFFVHYYGKKSFPKSLNTIEFLVLKLNFLLKFFLTNSFSICDWINCSVC